MRVFLAGIIQGSIREKRIHGQDYRKELRDILAEHAPEAEVFCPFDHHPNSIEYSPGKGRTTFLQLLDIARESDALVAFLPEASMGTAIEIWEAHKAGRPVVSISPMRENWAVKFLSDEILPDLEAFRAWVAQGGLEALIAKKKDGRE